MVSGTPTFVWEDDSSESSYGIELFDSRGTLVWSDANVPRVTGSQDVRVTYAGPALTPGRLYQFRATSYDADGIALSTTEDLRGVFIAN